MDGVPRVRVVGPLEPYAAGFGAELARLGYTLFSAGGQLRLAAHLSRWLAGEGVDVAALTPAVVAEFLAARRAAGYTAYRSPKALSPLLGYLRGRGVVPPPLPEPQGGPALMTDDYPPFRLDMGGSEPSAFAVTPTSFRPVAVAAGPTWSTGRIVTVVVGSLLLVGGVGAAVGGSAVLAADHAGRDAAGFLTTPTQTFTGSGYALVFDPLELRNAATTQNVDALVGDVRVNATGAAQGAGVFVGIGPADAVDGYLASVERARVVDFRTDTDNNAVQHQLGGGAPATPPTAQTFWVSSAAGPGPQQLTWTVAEGRWAAVVMNADGSKPVVAGLSAGAMAPGLRWVWIGRYMAAGIGLIAGALLVLLAVRRENQREWE